MRGERLPCCKALLVLSTKACDITQIPHLVRLGIGGMMGRLSSLGLGICGHGLVLFFQCGIKSVLGGPLLHFRSQ